MSEMDELDKLLSSRLRAAETVGFTSKSFTRQIMKEIALLALEERYKKDRKTQFLAGVAGFMVFGAILVSLYFLWMTGTLQKVLPSFLAESSIVEMIATNGFRYALVGFGFYLLLSRSVLTYFFMRTADLRQI